MGFSRQKYLSELPFLSSRNLPVPWIDPASPALAGRFFTTEPPRKLEVSFYKDASLIHEGLCHHDLITSQRSHLQITSHWVLGFNMSFKVHKLLVYTPKLKFVGSKIDHFKAHSSVAFNTFTML